MMPALFSLAQHPALVAAAARLDPEVTLFAFLDDLYLETNKELARPAFDVGTSEVEMKAGVRTHLGKLRIWSKEGGACPPGFEALGDDVWAGGADPHLRGLKVLGTPLGHPEFVATHAKQRIEEEARF